MPADHEAATAVLRDMPPALKRACRAVLDVPPHQLSQLVGFTLGVAAKHVGVRPQLQALARHLMDRVEGGA